MEAVWRVEHNLARLWLSYAGDENRGLCYTVHIPGRMCTEIKVLANRCKVPRGPGCELNNGHVYIGRDWNVNGAVPPRV